MNMLQMQQEGAYCQRVQKQTDDEETKSTEGFRQRRQGQGIGFWRRS